MADAIKSTGPIDALNAATADRTAQREENGRFASHGTSFNTLVLAPMSDPRTAMKTTKRIPVGYKVVALRKGVVRVGKRGAPTMCDTALDGQASCETVRFFKKPKTLAKACLDGMLDCSDVAFLKDQKRVLNQSKGTTRRYGSFVASKKSINPDDTIEPEEVIRQEQMHNKRSSDDNAFLFTIKQKARRGDQDAKNVLEYERERVDDAPIHTIASHTPNHQKLSVKALERLHDLQRAISLIKTL